MRIIEDAATGNDWLSLLSGRDDEIAKDHRGAKLAHLQSNAPAVQGSVVGAACQPPIHIEIHVTAALVDGENIHRV